MAALRSRGLTALQHMRGAHAVQAQAGKQTVTVLVDDAAKRELARGERRILVPNHCYEVWDCLELAAALRGLRLLSPGYSETVTNLTFKTHIP